MVKKFVRYRYADEHFITITWKDDKDHIIRFEHEFEIFEYIEDVFGIIPMSTMSGNIIGYKERK